MGVDPESIKVRSTPRARKKKGRPPAKRRAPAPKPKPVSKPATDTQIQHLIALGTKLGKTREDVETDVGKSLDSLTKKEIGSWLTRFTELIKERKAHISGDSSGTKRWRAHLPEGVDSFEIEYLTRQRDAGAEVSFTLFNGDQFVGRVIGFSPYNITIRTPENTEATMQKLAIAYYTLAANEGEAA